MTSTEICCVPGCKSNLKIKHVSFYRIKPYWINLISEYINKRTKMGNWQPRKFRMICGRHFKLCGIHDVKGEGPIYFPLLNISVGRMSSMVAVQNSAPSLHIFEDLTLGREITIPKVYQPDINLSKEKQPIKQRTVLKHFEHNYAVNSEYVNSLRNDYEETKKENDCLKNDVQLLTNRYEKEVQRLKDINHDLIRSNIKNESSRIEYPFRNILENEHMLKFYTGFPNRKCFQIFSNLMKPDYNLARLSEKKDNSRPGRKQYLEYEQQLILVLSRLRLGLLQHDLAYRFNVSTTTISTVWSFWINLLSIQLLKESVRLNKETELCNVQASFNNRIILECNETFFENSTFVEHQAFNKIAASKTYSRAKGLIEVTQNGYISFVSDLYPSHITEKELLEQCHFIDTNFDKELNETGYSLSKKRNANVKENDSRIGRFTVLQTHVQRILGFIKGFKILKGTFPNSMYNQIQLNSFWKICCYLINFTNKPLLENV